MLPLGALVKLKRSPIKRKTALRQVSAKRRAHKAAEKAAGAWEHMAAVKSLGCLVCGAKPVEVHHLPDPRSDFRVVPLCPFHHRREYGSQAYHYSRRNFNSLHGNDDQLLAQTLEMLQK
jgi:hypothetical protein